VSAFNKLRANNSDLADLNPEAFDISEALLNQALANITISALSLGTWYDNFHGSSTRVFNIYHFHNSLSFYLPYGFSLLLTFPVLVLGLRALQHNDVTAIDGGFAQLLMTTTGRTGLEDVAARGCLGGEENIPKELRVMKVRFGEMITGDGRERERLLSSRTGGAMRTSQRLMVRVLDTMTVQSLASIPTRLPPRKRRPIAVAPLMSTKRRGKLMV
jgi:hypothetical protein